MAARLTVMEDQLREAWDQQRPEGMMSGPKPSITLVFIKPSHCMRFPSPFRVAIGAAGRLLHWDRLGKTRFRLRQQLLKRGESRTRNIRVMDKRPQAANVKKNMSASKRPMIQKGSSSCDGWRWNRTEIDRGAVVVGIAKSTGWKGGREKNWAV